jgi:hypothetical protein
MANMNRLVTRCGRMLLAPLLLVLACAGDRLSGLDEAPEDALKVLFIGNSLTYVNDLPGLLAGLADSAHVERAFWYFSVAEPNYSLEDHWADGSAVYALDHGPWDVVVLQQGPSSLPENQVLLRDWSVRFAEKIRAAGGRPALYMVWPESSRTSAFTAVSDAYTGAAQAVDGMLFPVGRAWLLAWQGDASMPLYGADGFHPSVLGSWLAALVMLDRLYTVDLDRLPTTVRRPDGSTASIPAAARAALVQAAREANRSFGR